MADVLWVLLCLANQTGVNLTEELQKSFDKKTAKSFCASELDRVVSHSCREAIVVLILYGVVMSSLHAVTIPARKR